MQAHLHSQPLAVMMISTVAFFWLLFFLSTCLQLCVCVPYFVAGQRWWVPAVYELLHVAFGGAVMVA